MSDLRKLAADVVGRAALEERFDPPRVSALDAVLLEKAASADPELLKVAASFNTGKKTLNVYEELGGKYAAGTVLEHALGAGAGGAAGAALGSRWKNHPTVGAALGGGVGALGGALTGLDPAFAVVDRIRKQGGAGGEYGTKEAVSPKWIADRVRSGAEKASPGRLKDFAARMRGATESPGVHGKNWLDYDQAATEAAEALARKK